MPHFTPGDTLFVNTYICQRCKISWVDVWTAACDDRCPSCDTPHSPYITRDVETVSITTRGPDEPTAKEELQTLLDFTLEDNTMDDLTLGLVAYDLVGFITEDQAAHILAKHFPSTS